MWWSLLNHTCNIRIKIKGTKLHLKKTARTKFGNLSCNMEHLAMSVVPEEQSRQPISYVEWAPDQEIGAIPTIFTRKLYNELGNSVTLLDPAGNQHEVHIARAGVGMYFTDGRYSLGNFYSIGGGGWLKMTYMGRGRFFVRVFYISGQEVFYPRVPRVAVDEDDEIPIFEDGPGYEEPDLVELFIPYGELVFCHLVVKNITDADMNGGALLLPSDFCKYVLSPMTTEFKLIDEERRKWDCDIRPDIMDESLYRLTGGWESFRQVHSIKVGDVIMLGVTHIGSDVINYVKK